jgi:ribosome recycling factor
MDLINDTKQKMQKVLEVLRGDLATIRTGRAAPSLVENIVISAYDGSTRLKVMELATISAQDAQTLLITPFDPTIINDIQKGIMEANIGINPGVDGQVIRIVIPPLSQERRQQLISLMKQKLENGKVMIRQARHDAMTEVKKLKDVSEDEVTHLEKEVQKVTDDITAQIDSIGKQKEAELLQI